MHIRRKAIIVFCAVAAWAAVPASARSTWDPSDGCIRFNRQIDEAVANDIKDQPTKAVRNLQKRGSRLCGSGKKEQGARALRQALRLLQVKPDAVE